MNEAIALQNLGGHEEALALFARADPLIQAVAPPARYVQFMMAHLHSLISLGALEDAIVLLQVVIARCRQIGPAADRTQWRARFNLALVYEREDEPELAAEQIRAAVDLVERLPTSSSRWEDRIGLRQTVADVYRLAARLALARGDRGKAFAMAQRAKGRTLTDLLEARADLTALDRQELLLVQQHEAGLIEQDAFTLGMRHVGDQRKVQRAARLGHDPRTPASLIDVVAVLRPGEVFLDMFMSENDDSITLFLLWPDQDTVSWCHRIDGIPLQALVERWQQARTIWVDAVKAQGKILGSTDPVVISRRERLLADGNYDATMADAARAEQQVLAELGTLVFAEMLEQLDETVTTLIVSPDGLLHRLPLAAVTVPHANGQYGTLLDVIDLQLVPTASSLVILRGPHGPRVTWPAALLAAAPFATEDEYQPGSDPGQDGDRTTDTAVGSPAEALGTYVARDLVRTGETHQPLRHSDPEVRTIAAQLEAAGCPTTVLRQEATRVRIETDLPVTRLLHLATHGGALEPDETVLDYRIFLANETNVRIHELYDGEFSLKDVFLVTLSACSLGEVVQLGAEAMGFVQAFLQAGAGVVLAPLWAVDDRATKELMVRFYEELTAADKPTIVSAWRRACQWLRNEPAYTHLIYWAGFLPSRSDASLRLSSGT